MAGKWLRPLVPYGPWLQSNLRTTVTLEKWQDDRYIQGDRYIQVNFVENIRQLVPVVQKVGSTMHRINLYPLDSAIGFPNIYPLDSDLSGG